MTDPLKARLDRLRKSTASANRRALLYGEIVKMDDKHAADSLIPLQKASAPGKKLQKIGFLMLWVPEPTGVTIALGGPMILAGRYLDKKYNGATIHDIGRETNSALTSIKDFKNSII